MACINADGTLSILAKALLKSLEKPMTAEEIAILMSQPLFKIRANLREMVSAGLINLVDEAYVVSEEGKIKVASIEID